MPSPLLRLTYALAPRFRALSTLPALAALCLLSVATPSLADEVIYGPDGAPTVVQRKLHPISGKWEVGLDFGTALNTALVTHLGGLLVVSQHPNEWLDLGADLLFNATTLSGLVDQIRDKLPARSDSQTQRANTGDELGNGDQLMFAGTFRVRLAPVYGKIDLASELKLHFQAFVLLGAGGAYVKHESVNLCATAGTASCRVRTIDPNTHLETVVDHFQSSDAFKPVGELGGGLRFYLGETPWSLELAVRAYLYPASLLEAADLTNPASGTSKSYLALVSMFNVGFARMF